MNDHLLVRTLSAIVMIAVSGIAMWRGGRVFLCLVAVVGVIAFYEWAILSCRLPSSRITRIVVAFLGAAYIGFACYALISFRKLGITAAMLPVVATVATDVGAYFTGRAVGGPKIAPSISPSKTWSGLAGGVAFAAIGVGLVTVIGFETDNWAAYAALGGVLAVVAQVGDFLESFMKRRAGVKDSGTLIPGHGGVLDRIDGLLAVVSVCAAISLTTALFGDWA